MTKQLEGKTALITGGGTGIGRATALALAGEGCTVNISSRPAEIGLTKSAALDYAGLGIRDRLAGGRRLHRPLTVLSRYANPRTPTPERSPHQ
jgi:short chain dehydrogenase